MQRKFPFCSVSWVHLKAERWPHCFLDIPSSRLVAYNYCCCWPCSVSDAILSPETIRKMFPRIKPTILLPHSTWAHFLMEKACTVHHEDEHILPCRGREEGKKAYGGENCWPGSTSPSPWGDRTGKEKKLKREVAERICHSISGFIYFPYSAAHPVIYFISSPRVMKMSCSITPDKKQSSSHFSEARYCWFFQDHSSCTLSGGKKGRFSNSPPLI